MSLPLSPSFPFVKATPPFSLPPLPVTPSLEDLTSRIADIASPAFIPIDSSSYDESSLKITSRRDPQTPRAQFDASPLKRMKHSINPSTSEASKGISKSTIQSWKPIDIHAIASRQVNPSQGQGTNSHSPVRSQQIAQLAPTEATVRTTFAVPEPKSFVSKLNSSSSSPAKPIRVQTISATKDSSSSSSDYQGDVSKNSSSSSSDYQGDVSKNSSSSSSDYQGDVSKNSSSSSGASFQQIISDPNAQEERTWLISPLPGQVLTPQQQTRMTPHRFVNASASSSSSARPRLKNLNWIPFEYRKVVVAPDPNQKGEYRRGTMMCVDPNAEYNPGFNQNERDPFIMIDFDMGASDSLGYPAVSIHRSDIWPKPN